ncbi:hypothetical protein [Halomarina litorea]|uniref:hypothetical protein n=1 Tax=Halomarina litorea TaxID=2961595 RepID=UPI0020C269A0|nr:hypothetical protein [Halomarina sp. BCD28]
MSDYRGRGDRRDPPSGPDADAGVAPTEGVDRRGRYRLPVVGEWLRRRDARADHLPAFRRRVRSAYDVDHLARTVVRRGIVDPSEDIVEALAAVHLSQSLERADAGSTAPPAVPVAESERFVVYYGVAPDAPAAVTGPYWTLAREASYRQVHATFGERFAERIESEYEHRCRTLLEKGGWLVLAKPTAAWVGSEETWTLTATRAPREGYGIRGVDDARDERRDYALTDGPLMCRTVRPDADGGWRVLDATALAPRDRDDPRSIWRLVREDFAAWRGVDRDVEEPRPRPDSTVGRRATGPSVPGRCRTTGSAPNGD